MSSNDPSPVIFVLHAYQPITQSKEVLERVISKCYKPFFESLLENEGVKINLNITGCLLEKLTIEYPEIIGLIEKAKDKGQIEFLGSAFYHPILPLTKENDQRYQIIKQNTSIEGIFGVKPQAFFPPELALSPENIPIIIEEDFKIIISSGNSINLTYGGIYRTENREIFIVKRNRNISNKISFDYYKRDVSKFVKEVNMEYNLSRLPILIAMDLETYGEHHENYYEFFFEIATSVKTIEISKLIEEYNISTSIDILYSTSWSTSDNDLNNNINFPLWNHKENKVHQLLHRHLSLLEKAKEEIQNNELEDDYQAAHYSCQFWWASGLNINNGWWDPELVLIGLSYQRLVLDNLLKGANEDLKQRILKESENIVSELEQIIENEG